MLKVATHSGTFHADDVFAFAILRAANNGRVELIRTRDSSLLADADVVFDVGGTYDREARRYDHHMRDKPLRESGEPYSSAGLVWRDFGAAALGALLPGTSAEMIARIAMMVDVGLVRDVDLMDNGAMIPTAGHFSAVIEAFNPTFAEDDREELAAFLQAVDAALVVLGRVCSHAHAAVLAEESVAEAARVAEDPRIIVLDSRMPWEDAVFSLGLDKVLFVVRPAGSSGEAWACGAVPPELGSFAQRLSLPDAWGGMRDEDFAAHTGVADATFCHPARFVCGARSREGAVALAVMAVNHSV